MTRKAVINIRKEPYYRRDAFERGLRALGYVIINGPAPGTIPNSREDLLVLWNKKRGPEEQAADTWERQGGTVIVAENGYLAGVDKTYYAISVHGHNGSGWFPEDPTEDRFSKLGFTVKPFHHPSDVHLVCGQRGVGSRLMASPPLWGEHTTKSLRTKYGDTKVRFRPHPGNHAPAVPLSLDLARCGTVHIWSSASGVRALIEGHEVIHAAPHWILAVPGTLEERLNHMAHGQWHHEEILSGEPFARIINRLGEAKW